MTTRFTSFGELYLRAERVQQQGPGAPGLNRLPPAPGISPMMPCTGDLRPGVPRRRERPVSFSR